MASPGAPLRARPQLVQQPLTRTARLFERLLTCWMETASGWMNSDSILLRGCGLALGILGILTMYPLLAIWLLFDKKTR